MPPIQLRIKAVPGASRDAVAGVLGDRLKVKVAAPPEQGRANDSICAIVAEHLGLRASQVQVVTGRRTAEKTLRIEGWQGDVEAAAARLGIPLGLALVQEGGP